MVTAPNIAVFASGGGSNLQALIDANLRGDLLAPVALVVSNRSTSGALERARKHNIPWAHISSKTHPDPDSAILEQLAEHKIELIALAGYLKLISPKLIAHFTHKILNIHPGPLPRFGGHGMYGSHVHQAVLDSGVRVSGPCIFTVTKAYDEGPMLAEREVPVLAGDNVETLAARVLQAEHDLYWRTIQENFCTDIHAP